MDSAGLRPSDPQTVNRILGFGLCLDGSLGRLKKGFLWAF